MTFWYIDPLHNQRESTHTCMFNWNLRPGDAARILGAIFGHPSPGRKRTLFGREFLKKRGKKARRTAGAKLRGTKRAAHRGKKRRIDHFPPDHSGRLGRPQTYYQFMDLMLSLFELFSTQISSTALRGNTWILIKILMIRFQSFNQVGPGSAAILPLKFPLDCRWGSVIIAEIHTQYIWGIAFRSTAATWEEELLSSMT